MPSFDDYRRVWQQEREELERITWPEPVRIDLHPVALEINEDLAQETRAKNRYYFAMATVALMGVALCLGLAAHSMPRVERASVEDVR